MPLLLSSGERAPVTHWRGGWVGPSRKYNNSLIYAVRDGWEDNIKMDLGEIAFGDVDWIHLAQDRDRWQALVNMVMSLWVP
jgi:hypothetical protein